MDIRQRAEDFLKNGDPYEPEDGYKAREIIEELLVGYVSDVKSEPCAKYDCNFSAPTVPFPDR